MKVYVVYPEHDYDGADVKKARMFSELSKAKEFIISDAIYEGIYIYELDSDEEVKHIGQDVREESGWREY